jgi:Cap4 SAVED domain
MTLPAKPNAFLDIRVHDLSLTPSVTGLCVGYERGEWRASQFANHIIEWLPEFALKHSKLTDMHSGNAVQLLRNAAKRVYESEKFKNRGEFGELFLHAAIRQVFNSQPAISKIFYKSARNEPMKGFDAVHVVGPPGNLELWLGEAKFYTDIEDAINKVVTELRDHTETDYLRDEFLLIKGKIDPSWPHAQALEKLLEENTSLDEVFQRACIAVLLTYDSDCLGKRTGMLGVIFRKAQNKIQDPAKLRRLIVVGDSVSARPNGSPASSRNPPLLRKSLNGLCAPAAARYLPLPETFTGDMP